jgi:hypothetical protein
MKSLFLNKGAKIKEKEKGEWRNQAMGLSLFFLVHTKPALGPKVLHKIIAQNSSS